MGVRTSNFGSAKNISTADWVEDINAIDPILKLKNFNITDISDGLNHYVDVRVETTNKRDIFLIDLELISPYLAERPPDRESNWL